VIRFLWVLCALVLMLNVVPAQAQPAVVTADQLSSVRSGLEPVPYEDTPRTQQFYYRSNEWRQDLLLPHLQGLGGAVIGVGSDQLYTMCAMADCGLIVSSDFDARIAWLHRMYTPMLQAAATPEEFVALLSDESAQATRELVARSLAADPDVERMLAHFDSQRAAWRAYLGRVMRNRWEGSATGWLGRADWYNHIRTLHAEGRVVGRTADLTSPAVFEQVGRVLSEAGVLVRLVYFSNAEQFFTYGDGFKANMRSLPTDERTQVVRTVRNRHVLPAESGRWHFMVHQFDDFVARIESGFYPRSFGLVADLLAAGPPHRGHDGISTMDSTTPRAMAERSARRRRQSRR